MSDGRVCMCVLRVAVFKWLLYRPALSLSDISLSESCGRILDTRSYSGGSRFKSGPGDKLYALSFVVLLSASRKMPRLCRKLGNDRFLLRNSQFIIHCHSIIPLYVLRGVIAS